MELSDIPFPSKKACLGSTNANFPKTENLLINRSVDFFASDVLARPKNEKINKSIELKALIKILNSTEEKLTIQKSGNPPKSIKQKINIPNVIEMLVQYARALVVQPIGLLVHSFLGHLGIGQPMRDYPPTWLKRRDMRSYSRRVDGAPTADDHAYDEYYYDDDAKTTTTTIR